MHADQSDKSKWVGQRLRRFEDRRLLTGRGVYVDDVQLPGALTLAVLRSPYPHAKLTALDVSAAREAPGVVDVITGEDVRGLGHVEAMSPPNTTVNKVHHPLLVDGVARFAGEPVAVVLADTKQHARDAVDLMFAEWEPIDVVSTVEEAYAEGAQKVHDSLESNVAYVLDVGSPAEEVDAALAAADHVFSVRLESPRIHPVAMEPRTIAVEYLAEDDRFLLHLSTQGTFSGQPAMEAALNIPKERFDVLAQDVGGAFGAKGVPYREELLAVYFADKHKTSVRWTATRSDEFMTMYGARDQVTFVDGGFTSDGKLVALRVKNLGNLGAYAYGFTYMVPTSAGRLAPGSYGVKLAHATTIGLYTNRSPSGPYRGAGRPEGTLITERLIDVAARELSIDPVEIRCRNFLQPDVFPYTTPMNQVYDSGDYAKTLEHALEIGDYAGLVKRRDEARARGELFGIGLCTFVEPAGAGFESGRVRINPDGSIVLESGSFAHGQGHITTFAQIVADTFKVTPDKVTVVQGDSRRVPFGVGTGGSRSVMAGGGAGRVNATKVLDKMVNIAGHLLEVEAADVNWDGETFHPRGVPARGLTFLQVVEAAYDPARLPEGMEVGLISDERYTPDVTFPYGTHLAAVSIDRETGKIKHEAFVAVDDAGVIINPLLAEAQVVGGLAQGFGQALIEEMVYDEDGTLLTGSFGDYAMPRASDLPTFTLGETCTPAPGNVLGAKGLGESGTVGAPPALANAVLDALNAAGHKVQQIDFPITAEKVWKLLQS